MKLKIIIILSITIGLNACNSSSNSSHKKIQEYEKQFEAGKRDTAFLKMLLNDLREVKYYGINLSAEQVADAYLCTFPVEERYVGDNLNMFTQDINDFNMQSYRELLKNWDNIKDTPDAEQITQKIEGDGLKYSMNFTSDYINTMKVPSGYSFQGVKDAFATVGIDNLDKRLVMIQILQHAVDTDINTMIDSVESAFISDNYYPKSLTDILIYGGCQRIILDLCDKQQCIRMIELLSSATSSNSRSPYKGILHDFEGKKMHLEYYEGKSEKGKK